MAISRSIKKQFSIKLIEWFRENGRFYPWRWETDAFKILVSEFMLQRTVANQVLPVYNAFFNKYLSPTDIIKEDKRVVEELLKPLGMNRRTPYLIEAVRIIVEKYNGNVPDEIDKLTSLPGVGNYTAMATACFAFSKKMPLLDVNTIRLCKRIFGVISSKSRPQTDSTLLNFLESLIPEDDPISFNYALIDLASILCKKKHPKCEVCPVNSVCLYRQIRQMSSNGNYTLIDLFSGAGGMTLGFKNIGFKPIYAVEMDRSAATTYEKNFGAHVYKGLIEDLNEFPKSATVVIGGPPCQGFSPLGKMIPKEEHSGMNALWRHFLRVVFEVKPLVFVMENVPELLKSQEFVELKLSAEKNGYIVKSGVLNAEDFGVAQKRKRAFIVGAKGVAPYFPESTGERRVLRDVIGHIPLEPDGVGWHIGRNPTAKSIERYKVIPPGGNRFDLIKIRPDIAPNCWLKKKTGSTDVFGRLEWDKPALTIRTEFFKPEKGRYLHPEANRPITHKEAALIQSFPENFIFAGSKIEVARQIGNAVPPKLAAAVASAVKMTLTKIAENKIQEQSYILHERKNYYAKNIGKR